MQRLVGRLPGLGKAFALPIPRVTLQLEAPITKPSLPTSDVDLMLQHVFKPGSEAVDHVADVLGLRNELSVLFQGLVAVRLLFERDQALTPARNRISPVRPRIVVYEPAKIGVGRGLREAVGAGERLAFF